MDAFSKNHLRHNAHQNANRGLFEHMQDFITTKNDLSAVPTGRFHIAIFNVSLGLTGGAGRGALCDRGFAILAFEVIVVLIGIDADAVDHRLGL